MVRAISGNLATAQEDMGEPYIYLYFTSADGGTHYNYSSDQGRLLAVEHHEEAYNDYATIVLRNEDGALPDLRGYWLEIGYGYDISGTPDYEQTPRLWVKNQQHVSMMGVASEMLQLEGMWAKLREMMLRIGTPPYYLANYTTDTVYAIIDAILTLTEIGMTLDAVGDQDDSIIDTFMPQFEINNRIFENAAGVIYRLIRMTKCYLRPKTSMAWKVIYPQPEDVTTTLFYSAQKPYFYEYVEKLSCLVPNHIIVFANAGEDGAWTNIITAFKKDDAEIARLYEVSKVHIAGNITSQTDANARAAAILTRVKAEQMAGRLVIPHDVRIELHDKVTIYDTRVT